MFEVAAVVWFVLVGEPHHDGGGSDKIELHDSASRECAAIGARDARLRACARLPQEVPR